MSLKFYLELLFLAALWGASFMFMRVGVPEFGPIPLVALRTLVATIFLMPFLYGNKKQSALIENWKPIFFVGLLTAAFPYSLIGYTSLYAPSGYISVLNATVPIFSALVAFIWLKEKLSVKGLVGILVGFLGVVVLAFDRVSLSEAAGIVPVLSVLIATFFYGFGVNYTKVKLTGVSSLAVATGSQFFSTILLLPLALFLWPEHPPAINGWVSVVLLGVACTGIPLIIFFRLLSNAGPTHTVMVAYLIPVFGMLWGSLFLNEFITVNMIMGGLLTLAGVAITTGLGKQLSKKKKT